MCIQQAFHIKLIGQYFCSEEHLFINFSEEHLFINLIQSDMICTSKASTQK